MFGLGHLFYPWGGLLQILALVHFVKRRPETYWLWIILIGGPIGASAYLLVEAAPDARLLGGVFQGFGRRSRIQKLETDILDNPSAGNYEEVAELYLEEKRFQQARQAFSKAIDGYAARRAGGAHQTRRRARHQPGPNGRRSAKEAPAIGPRHCAPGQRERNP